MDTPSLSRIMVELQKAATRAHRHLAAIPGRTAPVDHAFGRYPHPAHHRSPIGSTHARRRSSYTKDGDAYIVIASDGGSPRDPDRYLNLQHDPAAEVEIVAAAPACRPRSSPATNATGYGATPSGPTADMPPTRRALYRHIPVVRLSSIE